MYKFSIVNRYLIELLENMLEDWINDQCAKDTKKSDTLS